MGRAHPSLVASFIATAFIVFPCNLPARWSRGGFQHTASTQYGPLTILSPEGNTSA